MVNYEPLWATMKQKGITKYQLIYHWGISSNTLRRMSHNEAISTTTLNELCLILDCQVQDILCYSPTEEEKQQIALQKAEIQQKLKRKK
ncbi:MAG: helix-turn-helix transcriptional regulator [Lachnospiraceae bacterium]|nr:helix-turn-helix transcriptional regulator [Lachnospiraceae bacterium]